MKKNVIIKLKDWHSGPDENYTSQLDAVGTLELIDGGFILIYEEPGEGMEGCVTTLKCEGDFVTMTREGSYNTQMIMEREKRHTCHYVTPMGEIVMGIFARRIEAHMGENGGTLLLNYTIDINTDFASMNELNIIVSEA